ncbi:hypothetical protein EDB81DRAFT_658196 [Dactylonectria macrodidyma]|uniref:Uncharacterized protein n=1 Tax=Dactylonectria macrodidyma TaxID=307937 RepID=A0A9P9EC31_9HYPO|nr:hypothetical protein EDB81DRAFT_658196 [Dactylonectria macrodidyma]
MKSFVTLSIAVSLGAGIANAVPANLVSRTSSSSSATIRRDAVVIGGGSSGTYAAVKLKRMGRSVAVVERHSVFGGHTSTYRVPDSNITIDYGVQGYGDFDVIRNMFASFDIPLDQIPLSETGFGIPNYVDFRNGRTIPNFSFFANLSQFEVQSDRYPYLSYTTRLPNRVPKDLLLPFGEFLAKYGLQDLTYNLFYNLEGFGDLLSQTTLYVMKYLNQEYLDALHPDYKGALVTSRRYNQQLYERAQELLGSDALVSSWVTSATRNRSGVRLVVRTPRGSRTIIARKLLIAMPLVTSNMDAFSLDNTERSLFSRFKASGWYVGLVRAAGLPDRFAYQNTRPDTLYNLPQLPSLYQMSPTEVPGTYLVRYGSQDRLSDDTVRNDMLRTFNRVRARVLGEQSARFEPAKLLAYSSHYPFNLHVTPRDISGGFYNRLDDLQGYRSTWYTGAALISHGTSVLWNFTNHLVDRMFEED